MPVTLDEHPSNINMHHQVTLQEDTFDTVFNGFDELSVDVIIETFKLLFIHLILICNFFCWDIIMQI